MPPFVIVAAIDIPLLLIIALAAKFPFSLRKLPGWVSTVAFDNDRIHQGHAAEINLKYSIEYQAGSRQPEVILGLLLGMVDVGLPQNATQFVPSARRLMDEHDLCKRDATRKLCHALLMAMAEVEMASGNFSAAAQGLTAYAASSPSPNEALALAALAHYLDGDDTQTRAVLNRVNPHKLRVPMTSEGEPRRSLQVMVMFLRFRLLDDGSPETLRPLAEQQAAAWEKWLEKAAPSRYGEAITQLMAQLDSHLHRTGTWYTLAVERITGGDSEAVIQEALPQKRTFANQIILATAYAMQARAADGEPFAQAAYEEAQQMGACADGPTYSDFLCKLARTTLASVRTIQGRFVEGAQLYEAILAREPKSNATRAGTAWAYFLAGDTAKVEELLNQLGRVKSWDANTQVGASIVLMTLYMGHVIMGADTRAQIQRLAPQELPKWEQIAEIHADNPFGERLAEILDEIQKMIED